MKNINSETHTNSSSIDDVMLATQREKAAFGSIFDTDSKANQYQIFLKIRHCDREPKAWQEAIQFLLSNKLTELPRKLRIFTMTKIEFIKIYFHKLLLNLFATIQGIAAVEFALALPLLIVIVFGSIEVTRYVLITQKLERVSLTLSDLVSQSETITTAQLNQIIPAAGQILRPYNFAADGYAIISSVTKAGGYPPVVNWQYVSSGTVQTSHVGISGGNATMPSGFTMIDGDTVIITEIFYNYSPILSGTIYKSSQMYRYSIYKPRLGKLTVLG